MDTGLLILMVVVAFIVGVVAGMFLGKGKRSSPEVKGTLYVYGNAPNGLGLFLEQSVPTADIVSQKQVIFDVVAIQPNSHE